MPQATHCQKSKHLRLQSIPFRSKKRNKRIPKRYYNLTGASTLNSWYDSQVTNASRHSSELREFTKNEFGTGPESPSEAHRRTVNRLLHPLLKRVFINAQKMNRLRTILKKGTSRSRLNRFLYLKQKGGLLTKFSERIWQFYFDIFGQRRTPLAKKLLAADRIASDCYQIVYTNLGIAKSIPSPSPFSFIESERSPATYRRKVKLSKLLMRKNPFPLIKLPYHRLINPWTLGAIAHETGHNLQSDLKLWKEIPKAIKYRLRKENINPKSINIWARWHKELFADLIGLLLIGPSFIDSLMDLLSRNSKRTFHFNSKGVHPTPYLRVLINIELLKRMGFTKKANDFKNTWKHIYPQNPTRYIPSYLLNDFEKQVYLVVNIICYQKYKQLGNKSLSKVVSFNIQDQKLVSQAARRIATGTDPGIVPERFLIGACREGLKKKLAPPKVLSNNFYKALTRR